MFTRHYSTLLDPQHTQWPRQTMIIALQWVALSQFLNENQKPSFHWVDGLLVIIHVTTCGVCIGQILLSPAEKWC